MRSRPDILYRTAYWALAKALLALAASLFIEARADATLAERPEVREFVREMVDRHQFVETELMRLVLLIKPLPVAVSSSVASPPPWPDYRKQFVNEMRLKRGLKFWQQNAAVIERASRTYGVPEEIVVSIIGVETVYGYQQGRFRVVDALSALAFDHPTRKAYFRSELTQFLLMAREGEFDLFAIRGSFAGALGIPQFMPSSYRRFGVDFDGDGKVDLFTSAGDSIASVANFLEQHGWIAGQAIASATRKDLPELDIRSELAQIADPRVRDMTRLGARPVAALPADQSITPVVLQFRAQAPEYWIGLHNFAVLTRYNRSHYYALAVVQLADALREARAQTAN